MKQVGLMPRSNSRVPLVPRRSAGEKPLDGAIKFNLEWVDGEAPGQIQDLIFWRNCLYDSALIGAYPDGVGYGNISKRTDHGFIISGSGTGLSPVATASQFTRVTGHDFETNFVSCVGPVKASSESLTHAAVYEASESVQAVVHGHHGEMWQSMYGKALMTPPDVLYGTPGLAREILRLFKYTNLESERFFVMAGHRDGIISFGPTLGDAALRMTSLL